MNLLMESLEHFVCFRALPKKNDAFDNIPVVNDHTVFGVDRLTDLAQPNLRAFVDGGDIPDANWGAVLSPKQRLADLFDTCEQTHRSDVDLLLPFLDEAPSAIEVVICQRLFNLADAQA